MPRSARKAPGGVVFHVLNRGVGRRQLFLKDEDYAAFERVMESTLAAVPVRLLSYCLMPNHWHLVLWPRDDDDLGRFMQRLTVTHTRRWQEHYHEVGYGHLYQGRFKSFPVQHQRGDLHYLRVCRYVESNARRAKLVERAEAWRWGSLWRRQSGSKQERAILSDWPIDRPRGWVERVNEPLTAAELSELRLSVAKGRPAGDDAWRQRMIERLGLQSSERERGRPRKAGAAAKKS